MSGGWITETAWQPDVAVAFTEARLQGQLPAQLPDTIDIVTTPDLDVSEAFGRMMPVMDLELLTIFGTVKPTRAQIEAAADDLMMLRPFDTSSYLVAYDDRGRPTGYVFCGAQVASEEARLCI